MSLLNAAPLLIISIHHKLHLHSVYIYIMYYTYIHHILTLQASPHKIGLPTNTALAPRANALNTSLPLHIPPSTYTSTLPLTASILLSQEVHQSTIT